MPLILINAAVALFNCFVAIRNRRIQNANFILHEKNVAVFEKLQKIVVENGKVISELENQSTMQ